MDRHTIAGLAVSWTGTIATAAVHDALAIVGFCLSLLGTVYAVLYTKARIRNEILRAAHLETELCEECKRGNTPAVCPVPESHRPKDCPLRRKN